MTDPRVGPDQSARETFRTGIRTAIVAAVAATCLLYWTDAVSLLSAVLGLLILFPVYLVVVASLLGRWLGAGERAVELRPVARESGTENGEEL